MFCVLKGIIKSFLSEVKEENKDIGLCGYFISQLIMFSFSIFVLTAPIVMIVIGAVYLNDCPAQKMIPISLIVTGCVIQLTHIIILVEGIRSKGFSEYDIHKPDSVLQSISCYFCLLYLVLGFAMLAIWLSAKQPQHEHPADADYCNRGLYNFAGIIMVLTMFGGFQAFCVIQCFKPDPEYADCWDSD